MRVERDSLGEKSVPDYAYWGSQTQRAIENFPVSGLIYPREMQRAIGAIKYAAAETNIGLGILDPTTGKFILKAAQEVFDGKLSDHFTIDVFQAGAGTSFNMNANEVIANRALELMGKPKGSYEIISPNDHVNISQSTNDVFPSTMRVAILWMLLGELIPATLQLKKSLCVKAEEFECVIKSGRTHLQDAVPIMLGQEFGSYAETIQRSTESIRMGAFELQRMNMGATAIGTGINTQPGYKEKVVEALSKLTRLHLRPADNLVEITQSTADFSRMSSLLRSLALELIRIANDLRLLSSGPHTGLMEIKLPAIQPGSSIMPGKINPSVPEMVDMVGFQVVGNDTTIAMAVQAGQLELNVMLPVIAHNILQSIRILTNACKIFAERCIDGIEVNKTVTNRYAESSEALVTALTPKIGYLPAAKIAEESLSTGKSVRDIVIEHRLMDEDEVDELLNPLAMAGNSKLCDNE